VGGCRGGQKGALVPGGGEGGGGGGVRGAGKDGGHDYRGCYFIWNSRSTFSRYPYPRLNPFHPDL